MAASFDFCKSALNLNDLVYPVHYQLIFYMLILYADSRMPLQRTKFSPVIDPQMLKEVVNHNPFVDPAKWTDIVDTLALLGEGAPTTGRSRKERVHLLMTYFKRDQLVKINR